MRPVDVITPVHASSFRNGPSLRDRVWWDPGEPALVLACEKTLHSGRRKKILLVLHDGVPRWSFLLDGDVHLRKAVAA